MARNVRFGVLLTGDERGAVRSMKLTRQEARRLERQVRDTGESAERTRGRFTAWAGAMGTLRGALGPLVGVGSAGLLGRMAQQTITQTAALQDAADTAGIGVERYQEFTKALGDMGGIAESVTSGALRRFNRRFGLARQGTGAAVDTLERMNISLEQGTGPALEEAVRKLAAMEDGANRAAAASQLFGEDAGPRLAATLGQGQQALTDAIEALRETNRILGEELVESASKTDDQFAILADRIRTQLKSEVLELNQALRESDNLFTDILFARPDYFGFAEQGLNAMRGGGPEDIREIVTDLEHAQQRLQTMEKFGGGEEAVDQQRRYVDQLQRRLEITRDLASGTRVPDDLVVTASQARRASLSDMGVGNVNIGTDMDLLRSRARTASRSDMGIGSIDFTGGVDMDSMARDVERMNELTTRRDQILRQIQTPQEKFNEQIRELRELEEAGVITGDQADRAFETYRTQLQQARAETEEMNEVSRELGFTFSSAFEDAIVQGENLRGVLQGLAEDVQRIILRQAVTEPMGNALASGISTFASGIFSGGGGGINNTGVTVGNAAPRANGGPVNSGGTYLVGERGPELLQMGRNGGSVTPNNQIGAAPEIHIHTDQDARVERTETRRGADGRQQVHAWVMREVKDGMNNGELDRQMQGNYGVSRRGGR